MSCRAVGFTVVEGGVGKGISKTIEITMYIILRMGLRAYWEKGLALEALWDGITLCGVAQTQPAGLVQVVVAIHVQHIQSRFASQTSVLFLDFSVQSGYCL